MLMVYQGKRVINMDRNISYLFEYSVKKYCAFKLCNYIVKQIYFSFSRYDPQ